MTTSTNQKATDLRTLSQATGPQVSIINDDYSIHILIIIFHINQEKTAAANPSFNRNSFNPNKGVLSFNNGITKVQIQSERNLGPKAQLMQAGKESRSLNFLSRL